MYSEDEIGRLAEVLNQMADKLEDHIQQLETAMERQEEFMGSFAHELKTPMTSIIGYADLRAVRSSVRISAGMRPIIYFPRDEDWRVCR